MGSIFDRSADDNSDVIYAGYSSKLNGVERPTPIFELKKKNAEGKYVVLETPDGEPLTHLKGKLGKVVWSENSDGKGGTIHSFKVHMHVDEGMVLLSLQFNGLGREAMNCLANLPADTNEIGFKILKYPSKNNGKMYSHMQVSSNGNKVAWKFGMSDMPRPADIILADGTVLMDNGKKKLNWDGVNNFLKEAVLARFPSAENTSAATAAPIADEEFGKDFPGINEDTAEEGSHDHVPDSPF